MRFLLLNQFYPPDVAPTGQYLHDLARTLVERGHTVRVLCSRRSYDGGARYAARETLDGVQVHRLPAFGFGRRGFAGKLLDYASFYGLLALHLLFDRSKPDLILALTTPPYIGLLARFAARLHRCRHAHWVMDLYPDVLKAYRGQRSEDRGAEGQKDRRTEPQSLRAAEGQRDRRTEGQKDRATEPQSSRGAEGQKDRATEGKPTDPTTNQTTNEQHNPPFSVSPYLRGETLPPSPSLLLRFLAACTRRTFANASLVVTLGPYMARRVARYVPGGRVEWVPLWSRGAEGQKDRGTEGQRDRRTEGQIPALAPARERAETSTRESGERGREPQSDRTLEQQSFRAAERQSPSEPDNQPTSQPTNHRACEPANQQPVKECSVSPCLRGESSTLFLLYSGNMGLGHRFTEFLTLAARLGPESPRWIFAGGGKRRAEIEAFAKAHPQARIELKPYVPADQLAAHLAAADVHLASLDGKWQGLMVPSKIQGIFRSGRPVIFVGGRENEIAGWILESGGGWCVAENDVEGLARAVAEVGDPAERARRGTASARYAAMHFSCEANCGRMAEMLDGR